MCRQRHGGSEIGRLFFRKSEDVGGIRPNLSPSGVSVSAGVKGGRVSTGPRGSYITVGSHGVHYRQRIGHPYGISPSDSNHLVDKSLGEEQIAALDTEALTDENAADLLGRINATIHTSQEWPEMRWRSGCTILFGFAVAVALCWAGTVPFAGVWPIAGSGSISILLVLTALCATATMVMAVITARMAPAVQKNDVQKRIFPLSYNIEAGGATRWQAMNDALSILAGGSRVWQITGVEPTSDWRRNAGSSELDARRMVQVSRAVPPFLKANTQPFCLDFGSGNQQLFFLPDRLYICNPDPGKDTVIYQAVEYEALSWESGTINFTETTGLPADTTVLGHIWAYVNKDGSPDRRFRDNYEVPICQYGTVTLHSSQGLNLLLHTSSAAVAQLFVQQFREAIHYQNQKANSAPLHPLPQPTRYQEPQPKDQPEANHQLSYVASEPAKKVPAGTPIKDSEMMSPSSDALTTATGAGETEKVLALLDAGAPINGLNERGVSPLSFAAVFGHIDIIKIFLDRGADCNIKHKDGTTPLISACLAGYEEAIESLLKAGANVNVQANGSTPLGIALYNRNYAAVSSILARGADPNMPGYDQRLPLEIAIGYSAESIVNLLLLAGADANAAPKGAVTYGYSLLECAITTHNLPIVQTLLQHGADPIFVGPLGLTPLMIAVQLGQIWMVQNLLRFGAPMDAKDSEGHTALNYASAKGYVDIIRLLQGELPPAAPTNQPRIASDSHPSDTMPTDREVTSGKNSGEPQQTYEQLLQELNDLIGLNNIKADVNQHMMFLQVQKLRRERGLKVPEQSLHMVFTGNPGTGKTTVARLIAELYKSMGVLHKGQMIETDRSELVAGYLGQTALKVQEVVKTALGGVLFIDEAYSLTEGEAGHDEFGHEAVNTLLKLMEDHRDDLIVIVAGYTEPMQKFIRSNPGLQSRFNKFLHFDDYAPAELTEIFRHFAASGDYNLHPATELKLTNVFTALYQARDETFGNARLARNLFEKAINAQANRMVSAAALDEASLVTLYPEDIPNA